MQQCTVQGPRHYVVIYSVRYSRPSLGASVGWTLAGPHRSRCRDQSHV